jgi:hypothetical protein
MDAGLAIMPAPIFLVTDDPRATAGTGDDHLLDASTSLISGLLDIQLTYG